jgi:hypothetical protein
MPLRMLKGNSFEGKLEIIRERKFWEQSIICSHDSLLDKRLLTLIEKAFDMWISSADMQEVKV